MEELTASEYLSLLNSMSTFAAVLDREGKPRFINRISLLKSLGYREDEVMGTPPIWESIWECMHFKHVASEVKEAFERALRGDSVQIEVNAMKPSGRTFPMILNISPLRSESSGDIKGVVVEGKSVEKEHYYQCLMEETLENIHECILLTDKEGRIVYTNKEVPQKIRMSEEQLKGLSLEDIPCYSYSDDVRNKVADLVKKALSGEHVTAILRARPPEEGSEERTVKIHAAPVEIGGEISGAIIEAEDITDFEQMTEELKRTHRYYKQILDSLQNIIIILTDADSGILYINNYAEKIFGISSEELKGKKFEDAKFFRDAEKAREHAQASVEKALRGEIVRGVEFHMHAKDGKVIHLLGYTLPFVDNGSARGALFAAYDITEKKQMENRLRELVDRLRAAQEELMTPVVQIWDKILALPVIGVIDSYRAQKITETLLDRIVKTKSEFVIIDISGVASVDTEVANHIIKTVKAASLLGCTCIITGIRPEIAQTMTHIGIYFHEIHTERDMQEGLKKCLEMLGYEIR